jgi:hypothetical protein
LASANKRPHAGTINGLRIGLTTQQCTHRFVTNLAVQIPDRRIDTGQRAADERTGEFHVGVDDAVVQRVDVGRIAAQYVPGDLAMQHGLRDIRSVGGQLAVALLPVARPDSHDTEVAVRPGLDAGDAPSGFDHLEFGVIFRSPEIGVNTLGLVGNR